MKVAFIRHSMCEQTMPTPRGAKIVDFNFYTIQTIGWSRGARNRSKNFTSTQDVHAYFNRLHAGGWLSDEHYDEALILLKYVRTESDMHSLRKTDE